MTNGKYLGVQRPSIYKLIVLVIGRHINNGPCDLERDLDCFNSHCDNRPNSSTHNHGGTTLQHQQHNNYS